MTAWSLERLLASLHDDIQSRLETVRKSFGQPGSGNGNQKKDPCGHMKGTPRRGPSGRVGAGCAPGVPPPRPASVSTSIRALLGKSNNNNACGRLWAGRLRPVQVAVGARQRVHGDVSVHRSAAAPRSGGRRLDEQGPPARHQRVFSFANASAWFRFAACNRKLLPEEPLAKTMFGRVSA